ncbi:MAG TPA: hypothetical protein VHI55_01580 [Gaiellaceae bacterium]|jgi:hypothetical protein|nr:hypothetical protein [Gaiellaceae bacterium]
MHKQILTPLVVLFASASLVIAAPRATAEPVSSIQPVVGPPDPWLQSLYAQARFKNVQAIDPWQLNLYARKAYETRTVAAPSQPASTGGFAWDDAGIGAGVVLGVLLVGATSVVLIRRSRPPLAH